jgi:hypothetical protein
MMSFGSEAGTQFADGLFNMLTESGIDTDEWSNAMDLLLNSVDWSDWDAMTQARLVIESLGGHLDTGSAAWR